MGATGGLVIADAKLPLQVDVHMERSTICECLRVSKFFINPADLPS
jgi:hypothetical protein